MSLRKTSLGGKTGKRLIQLFRDEFVFFLNTCQRSRERMYTFPKVKALRKDSGDVASTSWHGEETFFFVFALTRAFGLFRTILSQKRYWSGWWARSPALCTDMGRCSKINYTRMREADAEACAERGASLAITFRQGLGGRAADQVFGKGTFIWQPSLGFGFHPPPWKSLWTWQPFRHRARVSSLRAPPLYKGATKSPSLSGLWWGLISDNYWLLNNHLGLHSCP